MVHLLCGVCLLIFIYMGFLDTLSSAAPGLNAVSGIAGGLVSALTGSHNQRKMARYQQKLQMELNEQQQKFARQNAQTDYERQRALVRDNASLERQGRMNAGLSLAGDFGNGSANASPTSSPSAGSAPSISDPNTSLLSGISQIQASVNSLIQNRAANAGAEAQELQNDITKQALTEKIFGAKGEGLKAGVEGKKAGALLISDVQKGKDEASITANNLWTSNNDAAYASANAFNNANALLSQSLQAKELYEKAKLDKDMTKEQLQLFKDTYEYSVQAAKQNVDNLKKQGVVLDTQAEANKASASQSYANAAAALANKRLLDKKAIAHDIENSINGNPKVKEAARQRLINLARQTGPQNFGEYAWSVFNDDNATTSQKWKATGALLLSFFGGVINTASSSAGKAAGTVAGQAAALNAIVP